MYKVYPHRSRNGGILEEAWSTRSLREDSNRHCCWGVNTQSISATANGTGPNQTRAQWKFTNDIGQLESNFSS